MFNDRKFLGGAGAYKALNSTTKSLASGLQAYNEEYKAEKAKRDAERFMQAEEEKRIQRGIADGKLDQNGNPVPEKNFFDVAGDVIGGIADTIGKTARGAYGLATEGVEFVANMADTSVRQGLQAGLNDRFSKQAQEIKDRAERGEISWEEASRLDGELRNSDLAERANAVDRKVRQQITRGNELEDRFVENARDFYEGAQFIPGFALGAETGGMFLSSMSPEGDDGAVNKGIISLTQRQDWDKLNGDEKEAALTSRNLGGVLSTLDIVPGLGYGGRIGKTAIKDLSKVGAKTIAGRAAVGAAAGGATGAALGAGLAAVTGGDIGEGIQEGIRSGIIGGALGAPLDAAALVRRGGVTSRGTAETARRTLSDIDADLEALRTGKDESVFTPLEEPAAAPETKGNTEPQTQASTSEPEAPQTRVVNEDAFRERFRELSTERRVVSALESRSAPSGVSDIDAEIASIDAGNAPRLALMEDVQVSTAKQAVDAAIVADPQDSLGIQRGYNENANLREQANRSFAQLFTQEKFETEMLHLNAKFKIDKGRIDQLPEPARVAETERLNAQYEQDSAMLGERLEADAPKVEEVEEAMRVLDGIDANMVAEWNGLTAANPGQFANPDSEAVAIYRNVLTAEKARLELDAGGDTLSPVQKADAVQDATINLDTRSDVAEVLDNNPGVYQAVADNNVDVALTAGKTGVSRTIDYWGRAPRTVISKWGTSGNAIIDAADTAIAGTNKFNGRLHARFIEKNWNVAIKGDYADQTVDFLDAGVPLKKTENETDKHFAVRSAAAKDIKAWFRAVGKELGIDEKQLNKNYLPHVFDQVVLGGRNAEKVAETIAMLSSKVDANGNKLSDTQIAKLEKDLRGISPAQRQIIASKNLYKVENGFLKKRQGAEGWSRDLPQIISDYARSAAAEIYQKPALEKIQKASTVLEREQTRFLDDWIAQWKGQFGPKGKLEKASDVARRTQNVALMGASLRTVALQLGGIANIWIDSQGLGGRFFGGGLRAMQASVNPNSGLRKEAMREGVFEGSFSGLLTGGKGISSLANKTEKVMYSGISAVDSHMRLWAYDMGKRDYAKSLGKNLNQLNDAELALAKKAGVQKAKETQFSMDALDVPLSQNSPAGKFLTQIQQFNIKQTDYNLKIFFGSDKSFINKQGKLTKQGATRLTKALVGYGFMLTMMTSMGEKVFGEDFERFMNPLGFDPEDLLPFGEQVVSAGRVVNTGDIGEFESVSTPLLSFLFGSQRNDGLTDYASIAAQYAAGKIDQAEYDRAMAKLPGFLTRNILPGGTQLVRSLEGADTLAKGESVNGNGSTRFLVNNKDGWNVVKGLLGGQYATDEGQQWLRNGMQTISKDWKVTLPNGDKVPVSEYARTLDPEDQAQYIVYYQTKQRADEQLKKIGLGRSEVQEEIRNGLKNGTMSPQEAFLRSENYNNNAFQMYAPYWNGNTRIPERLKADLQDTVLLDSKAYLTFKQRSISTKRQAALNSFYEDDLE